MDAIVNAQSQLNSPDDIEIIQELIRTNPTWNRRRLSRELASLWNWRAPNGTLRDMACRTYLLKLHRRGSITLPTPQKPANNDHRRWKIPDVPHSKTPIETPLKDLTPLIITPVRTNLEHRNLIKCLIHRYHHLGYRGSPGESLYYLIQDCRLRTVACLIFGAAAWSLKERDRLIGWDKNARKQNLPSIINNQRFLILPWVKCVNLASHILGQIAKRIAVDYQHYFNHPVYLLETFVQTERFHGTCYQAANWICLGQTTGRTRNDRYSTIKDPIKDIYIYPLQKNFRQLLVNHKLDSLP